MKIIVAHDGKQHVNQLLIGVHKRGWLQRFYVGFASNHLPAMLRQHPKLKQSLQKKRFTGIDEARIRSLYVSVLLMRILTTQYQKLRIGLRLFDHWVASQLHREPAFHLLISYENCNLMSFRKAKKLGKVTVLDLAQVHHHTIDAIQQNFSVAEFTSSQNALLDRHKQSALDLTDYILTLSSFATQSLISNGIHGDRIYEVNLGVDSIRFQPAHKTVDGLFRILFVGTITYRKGIKQLIDAFQQLQLTNAELLLIGPVGDASSLLAQCTGAIRHIPFLHHDELVGYYQQADVFVFPSYLDSWGQVVLEAMSCGTPVIVSDNTGAKDAVAKGGGFVIPTGNEAALQAKIRYFYDHRSEVDRLGREARAVAEQYTWNHYYEQLTNALAAIAQREHIPL